MPASAHITPPEIAGALMALRTATARLREGVGTELDWSCLASGLQDAKALERLGIVRGLAGHLQAVEDALHGICRRALASGAWQPTELYWQEIDHLNTLVDLHEHQLQRLVDVYGDGVAWVASGFAVAGALAPSAQVQEALL